MFLIMYYITPWLLLPFSLSYILSSHSRSNLSHTFNSLSQPFTILLWYLFPEYLRPLHCYSLCLSHFSSHSFLRATSFSAIFIQHKSPLEATPQFLMILQSPCRFLPSTITTVNTKKWKQLCIKLWLPIILGILLMNLIAALWQSSYAITSTTILVSRWRCTFPFPSTRKVRPTELLHTNSGEDVSRK